MGDTIKALSCRFTNMLRAFNYAVCDLWVLSEIITGINENNQFNNIVNIFPNPFTTQASIESKAVFTKAVLTVFNSFGQLIKQMDNISGQYFSFQRDGLPAGIYYLRFTQNNKTTYLFKICDIDCKNLSLTIFDNQFCNNRSIFSKKNNILELAYAFFIF